MQGWYAPQCYYNYHAVRYGVYLDNRYEINRTRRRQKTIKEIARRDGMFVWYKVPKELTGWSTKAEQW